MRYFFPYEIGTDQKTGIPFNLDADSFKTHYHFLGATGTGKTTLLEIILQILFVQHNPDSSFFILDPFGGFAKRLLRFIASTRFCPQSVRERVVYFEPANTDWTTGFDPLRHDTRPQQDYQVARAMDLLLRGSESQDISGMPRLRRFLHQALFDISQAGLPLSFLRYLLSPGTSEHAALLTRLSPTSQAIWRDLLEKHGNKAIEYLDSTRNRVSLFSDYVILERMFSSTENRFDVSRFIREGKIVIINLTPGKDRIVPWHVSKTIGSMIINEVFNEGVSVMAQEGKPSDIFLAIDEFQRYLGPDIFDFLPVVRQMGIHLLLAHQSLSQLDQGDIDLTPMIAQARSRFMFANDFEDAQLIAEEIASIKWNPDEIKYQMQSHRQRLVGHRIEILKGGNSGTSHSDSKSSQEQKGESAGLTINPDSKSTNTGKNYSASDVTGVSDGTSSGESWNQNMVPIHEDFYETTGVQFRSREEVVHEWRQKLSRLQTGECFFKQVNDPELHHLQVNYLPIEEDARSDDQVAALLEQNYLKGPFIRAVEADKQLVALRQELISGPTIRLTSQDSDSKANENHKDVFDD